MIPLLLFQLWAICSLTSFLLWCALARNDADPIERWVFRDWVQAVMMSVAFPVMWVALFCVYVAPWLIKEREIRKDPAK